jgi:hypothetical protein
MRPKRPSRKAKGPAALPFLPEAPPLLPVREAPVENGKRLATLYRGHAEEMRVNWAEYNGYPFLNLCVWQCGLDGVWRPDKKRHATVKVRELAAFSEAVQVALELATGHG